MENLNNILKETLPIIKKPLNQISESDITKIFHTVNSIHKYIKDQDSNVSDMTLQLLVCARDMIIFSKLILKYKQSLNI